MNTRRVLLVSDDPEICGIVKISALTLTKLNCQISIDESVEFTRVISVSDSPDLNLIIVDYDNKSGNTVSLIEAIRQKQGSAAKKILLIHDREIDKDLYFKAGCDSIMHKKEFKRVINNILTL